MEEIFTGQEWARFLASSTNSQSASSSSTQAEQMGLTSSINQSGQNEQTSQWNYREATGHNGGITQSQISSGGFHIVDTNENMFGQRKTPSFGQVLHNGLYGLSDSGSHHLEGMDQSVSPVENNHPAKEETHVYLYNQRNNTEQTVNPSSSSSGQNVNQSQMTEINHNHFGGVYEVLPVLDLSYLKVRTVAGKSFRFNRR